MHNHLVILHRLYVEEIFSRRKDIECRFTKREVSPHLGVEVGDRLWLKESSGPVRGLAVATGVQILAEPTRDAIADLRSRVGHRIRADEAFWAQADGCRTVTLIKMSLACRFKPFYITKSDRRAWVVLGGPLVPGQRFHATAGR